MKEQSVQEQLKELVKRRAELSDFRMQVNDNLVNGDLDEFLTVRDSNGEYPVVIALGREPLALLVERVSAEDGMANIFIKGRNGVSFITSQRCVELNNEIEDLSNLDEWYSGESDIDLFVDYLRMQKHGVIMPDHLPNTTEFNLNLCNDSVPMNDVVSC